MSIRDEKYDLSVKMLSIGVHAQSLVDVILENTNNNFTKRNAEIDKWSEWLDDIMFYEIGETPIVKKIDNPFNDLASRKYFVGTLERETLNSESLHELIKLKSDIVSLKNPNSVDEKRKSRIVDFYSNLAKRSLDASKMYG